VVLKAELAQSYMAQPKISFLSFTIAWFIAMIPPQVDTGCITEHASV
jgi:hypothetical protein